MEENRNEELMEVETVESDMDDYTEGSGSGKVLGLALAGVAGVAAIGVAAYKKLKEKKDEKKPRKRRKLMWVEVEEPAGEEVIDSEAKEVDEESETEK